jgi:hypothetical protein
LNDKPPSGLGGARVFEGFIQREFYAKH